MWVRGCEAAKRAWEGRTMGTLDHKAIRVQRAYRRYLWRRSRQPAEVTGIMDDVAVMATPKAIAAVAPRLEARLTRDGATLETTKCVWTTLGGPEIRKLFPEYAKVGCASRRSWRRARASRWGTART